VSEQVEIKLFLERRNNKFFIFVVCPKCGVHIGVPAKQLLRWLTKALIARGAPLPAESTKKPTNLYVRKMRGKVNDTKRI